MSDETQSDFPQAWKPEPGDSITGELAQVEVIDPNGNGAYPCVTIKTADGTLRNIHAFHTVLRNGLARRRPKIGDELAITYHGKREGGAYGSYHSYAVSGGQTLEMDWESWLPEDERRGVPAAQTAAPPIASAPMPSQQPQTEPAPAGQQFGDEPPF